MGSQQQSRGGGKTGAVRPPIEPIINRAHASVVSTLEGRRIIRLMYALQFEASAQHRLCDPGKQRLEKCFVNGASVPFKANGKTVTLPVQPARAGDESAKVELFVVEQQGGYALSGRL